MFRKLPATHVARRIAGVVLLAGLSMLAAAGNAYCLLWTCRGFAAEPDPPRESPAAPSKEHEAKAPSWAKVAPEQVAAAEALGVPVAFENSIGMRFILIPSGTFMMGSRHSAEQVARRCAMPNAHAGWFSDEHPRHEVALAGAFYMAIHEVTQECYEEVSRAKGGKDKGKNRGKEKGKLTAIESPVELKGPNNPVGDISWSDVEKFCKTLNSHDGRTYALPTEAQWEYACRAGTTTPFCFGETISTDQVNYHGDYTYAKGRKGKNRGQPTPVGSFPPNAWGLYDMHGNVSEWCADLYDGYAADSAATEPVNKKLRVVRGGSWRSYPGACRSAFRSRSDRRSYNIGFRVCCALPTESEDRE